METAGMTSFIWNNRIVWLLAVVVIGVSIDQGSKLWAIEALTRPASAAEIACDVHGARKREPECRGSPRVTEHGQRVILREIPVIKSFVGFKYAENPAAAFFLRAMAAIFLQRPIILRPAADVRAC